MEQVRMYNDNLNLNKRFYRESESFVKISKDVVHLRDN